MLGSYALIGIAICISAEGLAGGYSYVSAFSRLSSGSEETATDLSEDEAVARKEFRISCVGFGDVSFALLSTLVMC